MAVSVASVAAVVVDAGAALLVLTGGAHLLRLEALAAALEAQGWGPRRLLPTVAGTVAAVELLVGGGRLAAAVLVPDAPSAAMAAAAVGALHLVLAAYLLGIRRLRPGAPCGCGPATAPAAVGAARAGVLAGAAGAFVALGGGGHAALLGPAVVLAVLLAVLPGALAGSRELRTGGRPTWS